MKPITDMTKEDIEDIKLIIFDVDGVIVRRGTKISQQNGMTSLETKKIAQEQIEQIKQLHELGLKINISSGRGLYMLQDMFRAILPFTSLTYENGSCTWDQGELIQHVNSFAYLHDCMPRLQEVEHKHLKGFEPKELIITIHAHDRIPKIEEIMAEYDDLYCLWNGEAYDIGVKDIQTKGVGVKEFRKHLGLKKNQVMAIGDNYNDKELLDQAGTAISADRSRVEGDFFVPLDDVKLPADLLMDRIITLRKEE